MKTRQLFVTLFLLCICLSQSCTRSRYDVWEDTKSAGRHLKRGVQTLCGHPGGSRQVCCRNDFECIEDEDYCTQGEFQIDDYQENCHSQDYDPALQDFYSPMDSYTISQAVHSKGNTHLIPQDFIPLEDSNSEINCVDYNTARPPRETPGEQGSSIPGIQAFYDPSTHPQLANLFLPIYFDYNSSLIKGSQNLETIHRIVEFLQYYPHTYLFIEGHTDERGAQAYNLALGSRRANAVRDLFINQGIHPDRLFTISYGKERPVVLEHHEEGWAKNRRAEFKIYER